jgi:hypothetical protein
MSNTKKYKPRPYFNVAVMNELDEEDTVAEQNPYVRYTDQDLQNSDTQSKDNKSDTSDKKGSSPNESDSKEETFEKRWKDLKKHYDTVVPDLRNKVQDLEVSLEKKNSFNPPKTMEEMESFREQHPEFYDVMLSLAYHQASELGNKSGNRIQQLEEKLAEAEQARAFAEIAKAHPDYLEIVKGQDFSVWLEKQALGVQSWVKDNSNDAALFIRSLDLYKLDTGITKQMPSRKGKESNETRNTMDTSAADSVSVSGSSISVGDTNKRVWSRDEIRQIIASGQFEKFEEELDEAMSEGRIR